MRKISAGNLKNLMLLLNFRIYCTKANLLIKTKTKTKKTQQPTQKWTTKTIVKWKFGDWGQEVCLHLQRENNMKNTLLVKLNHRIVSLGHGLLPEHKPELLWNYSLLSVPASFLGYCCSQVWRCRASKECVCLSTGSGTDSSSQKFTSLFWFCLSIFKVAST